ncbi:DNA-3-methyladenine glycosylase 2 family protein [Marinicella litoralis]|uniref:DNA-3-methyladenine glycosylase II n=1 Tax=Marinicella litoralis TaxID=644220 RepID=A0A4R6XJ58_9GAMM|nr:AlkA N-terminal domain-containing protein [Marinicella litoralis]TDR17437.1 DNA-3-methyladenine glycosylase II [Marinicella litoralis]
MNLSEQNLSHPNKSTVLDRQVCQNARLSRDARFDGLFFTAVKTTGIYCRSVCPATPPKESNVDYFATAVLAANAGFRPCLRCRPDSAPYSAAWLGSQALLKRAVRLIDDGTLERQSIKELATYLGVSDRYLRQLFVKHFGTAPKAYALYQQCLFAKQLIHQTRLPINQIAYASGFNSIRRFNDCFIKMIQITPSDIRRKSVTTDHQHLKLKLSYRPPFDWKSMQTFLAARFIPGIETVTDSTYGRTFETEWAGAVYSGYFEVEHLCGQNAFNVSIKFNELNHLACLRTVTNNIRRLFDLAANTDMIENHLLKMMPPDFKVKQGLRIPGIWSPFEAGVRAILGQQISVKAARNLVIETVNQLGVLKNNQRYFPTPEAVINSDLAFLKMPGSRKNSLKNLAHHCLSDNDQTDLDSWLALKGIGPWTVNYSKLRGISDPDVFLAGDSGINNALKALSINPSTFNPDAAAPWRSYLTFQLWSHL